MSAPCQPRLPAAPIMCLYRDHEPKMSNTSLRRAYQKAKLEGSLTVWQADELCIRLLGRHPSEVYGEAWWRSGSLLD